MSAEDHNGGRSPRGDPAVEDHHLDSVARGLASGTVSRRQAVRWMGGALLGSALAIFPGVEAFAAPKPPQGRCPSGFVNCRGTCVRTESNPSHCGGCYIQCSPNEVCTSGQCCAGDRVCGSRCCGADESCCDFGGGSAVCCPSGTYCGGPGLCCQFDEQVCGGQCVSTACSEGEAFNPFTCRCETSAAGCSFPYRCGGSIPFCGSGAQTCLCTASVEGPVICGGNNCGPACTSSAECETIFGPGAVCQAPGTGCCGQACIPPCGSPSTITSVSSTGKTNTG